MHKNQPAFLVRAKLSQNNKKNRKGAQENKHRIRIGNLRNNPNS